MNKPTSVATQTEVTQTKSVQAQTEPPSRSLMFYAISAANLKENDKYYTGLPNYYSNVFAAFTIYYSHMKADHTRPVIVKLRLNFSWSCTSMGSEHQYCYLTNGLMLRTNVWTNGPTEKFFNTIFLRYSQWWLTLFVGVGLDIWMDTLFQVVQHHERSMSRTIRRCRT